MLDDLLTRKPYNAVTDFVDAPVARGLAAKVAFIDAERSLTYGELQTRTCRFASALKDLGLRPEERLALLLYDSVDFPVAFWGALRAGNVALPLNTLLTAEQYAYILSDSRAAAIVVAAPLAKTLIPILDRLPRLRTIILVNAGADEHAAFAGRDVCDFADMVAHGPSTPFAAPTLSDEVAFWMYTSGLDRRTQGRQARPHHADGGGTADGPARHRHPRRRHRLLRGEVVLLLRHGQRHGVPDVRRRDDRAVAAKADA